jgi:amylosucrase
MRAEVVDRPGDAARPPPLERVAADATARLGPDAELVVERIRRWWPEAERALRRVYGAAVDTMADALGAELLGLVADRSPELRRLDSRREAVPDWFQQPSMVGYVCYADRFAGDLSGVAGHLDYLAELGVTYLHLMPLLRPRAGENDGGYAVQSYDEVDPALGTMDDLDRLAGALRRRGMSLCVDVVMNHTAREHEWAQRALAGDPTYKAFYLSFPDRQAPDAYERTLREVFPDFAPGSFTFVPESGEWVWTTFNEFQWDLNHANPDVFRALLGIMGRLANRGVEVLRLDAAPFIWKRLGTDCENQPEVHDLLVAYRALLAIAAPATVLKAEAIVPPDRLVAYLGAGDPERIECGLAYHNQLMVMLWSSLATSEARLITSALGGMEEIPAHASWVTYVRCHDDIGWAVTDEDAATVGWGGAAHRHFLNDFYSGAFPGSFARGELFQRNEETGDARISGTAASLAGVEAALAADDAAALDLALARVELLYAVAFAFGGVPLVYMGDELALRNDRSYLADPAQRDDSRWLHRPRMDWSVAERRHVPGTVEARTFSALQRLASARAGLPQLHGGGRTGVIALPTPEVLCVRRKHRRQLPLWILANCSAHEVTVDRADLPTWEDHPHRVGLAGAGARLDGAGLLLPPYGYAWLTV